MKTVTKTFLCACSIILLPIAMIARNDRASTPAHELPEFKAVATLPEVVRKVAPTVTGLPAGSEIEMRFTIDEHGRPKAIRTKKSLWAMDHSLVRDFASQMMIKLSLWRFNPALDTNKNPVAVKVRMPVRVVEKGESVEVVANLFLDSNDRS